MMDNERERIIELLKGFSPAGPSTKKPKKPSVIRHGENPMDPALMSYCFDNILGFEIVYRPAEKVNYVVSFDYKGTYGHVSHRKMDYELMIESEFRGEVLTALAEAKRLLEDAFIGEATNAIRQNKFTLVNDYLYFREKFDFYNAKIQELKDHITVVSGERSQEYLLNPIALSLAVGSQLRNEMRYAMESYVDVFYSFMEHLLTLLLPFTVALESSKLYADFIHNPKWTWDKKIRSVANVSEVLKLIEPLRRIKEIHRNRNAHGMFSRELKVYAQIEGFGRYPLYMGKEYLRGFVDDSEALIDWHKYREYRRLFDGFLALLDEHYGIPMLFIKSGLPIPADVASLIKGIDSVEEARPLLEKLLHHYDNQLNMDW